MDCTYGLDNNNITVIPMSIDMSTSIRIDRYRVLCDSEMTVT